MRKTIKVRFNLSSGKNFMKWKVEHPNGMVEYLSPDDVQLVMSGCVLKNHKKTATKIFEGFHKTVCAWILCDEITVLPETKIVDNTQQVKYNPRVQPNWVIDGEIADNSRVEKLHTLGKGVFVSN
jgi:hypothetical protein